MTLFEGSQMCCFLLTLPLARMLDEQVSDDDRSTLFSFLARGASQGYAPQSGEIIGILKQLKDEMSEDLAAAHKEEEANYAGLIAAKEEIATLTATIETKLTRQGNLAVEVGSLNNDVADTQRSLAADQELAAKLAESRSSQSSEWEERLVNLTHLARHTLISLRSTYGCGWSPASATSTDRLPCDSRGALCTS